MNATPNPVLPPIVIPAQDAERLLRIARTASERNAVTADYLLREIERADLVDQAQPLTGIVTMGSDVEFRDDITGQDRWGTLVYPQEADVTAGKLSVLSPIGAALIGLSVGQSIEFQTPSGGWRSLTVLRVRPPL
jgi:regulator of nucleoside diphosphate kinase